jgi:hypothetical protein
MRTDQELNHRCFQYLAPVSSERYACYPNSRGILLKILILFSCQIFHTNYLVSLHGLSHIVIESLSLL